MSFALGAATKVHSTQVDAAVKTQDLIINLAQKFADTLRAVGDKAVPDALGQRVSTLSGPVTKTFGTPAELASHLAQSAHDWAGIEYRFRAAVLDAVLPVTPASGGTRPAS
jgi:hypothetical protein